MWISFAWFCAIATTVSLYLFLRPEVVQVIQQWELLNDPTEKAVLFILIQPVIFWVVHQFRARNNTINRKG